MTFESDLSALKQAMAGARSQLSAVVSGLKDSDLDAARRGGWTVSRVLEHVIGSEFSYARLVRRLRNQADVDEAMPSESIDSTASAIAGLEAARGALMAAIDGVDEESFYRLEQLRREEYSVMSVLENVLNHDREHSDQITAILSGPRTGS
jgi:hypothetical protein